MKAEQNNLRAKKVKKVIFGVVTLISLVAAALTISGHFEKNDMNRNIKLVFTDMYNKPHKHARVCLTGQDVDMGTTSDGDVSFNVKSEVKVLQGIIYFPHPVQFKVNLVDGVDKYIVKI